MQNLNRHWIVKELVQAEAENFGDHETPPLQLLHFKGHGPESDASAIWFVGGFLGATKNDGHFTNLIFRAIEKLTFDPAVDVYLTPLANPSSNYKAPRKTVTQFDMLADFPLVADYPLHEVKNCQEAKALMRWCRTLKPKVLVTFSTGLPKIRYKNIPEDIVQKLVQFSEKPAYEFGEEPQDMQADGTLIPRDPTVGNFGSWAVLEGYAWIDISVDPNRKNFDDLRETDWRSSMGPAIKWLIEGFRFNPPVEEPSFAIPAAIPALEMPPEFANL